MKKLNKKGFSLVELIIVIAIMAVLIGVLAPTYLGHVKSAKISADIQNANELATSIAVKAATSDAIATKTSWTTIDSTVTDSTIPTIKVDSTYGWVYKSVSGNIAVGVKSGSNEYELYPGTPAAGPWSK